MPKHLEKISEETIHENPWWKYKHDKYIKPNGEEGDYFYAETRGMSVIVPVLADGRIVLTLQHRYLRDRQSIEFPGGGIKEGQMPEEAATAELYEETGCVVKKITKIGVFDALNGLVKDTSHVFLVEVDRQEEQHLDDTEDIDIIYRQPEDIEEMIINNEIWDGITIATWALVRHHLIK